MARDPLTWLRGTMTIDDATLDAAAKALFDAENNRTWVPPFTETLPGFTIEDAYAVAERVTAHKVAAGRVVKGYKVGYTSDAMREQFGATEPDYGALFDNWFIDSASTIPASRLHRPWAEVELAFVLGRPLGGADVNVNDVLAATEFVIPALEIVDSRLTHDGANGGVIDSIADAASCGLLAVGGRPISPIGVDLASVSADLVINDEIVASGRGEAVMGNPANAIAWLARKLSEFGVQLEAGHTLLSGSFLVASELHEGDVVVGDFGDLGRVVVEVGS